MVFSPLESFNLEGKTAVVTGGAGILGRHFVIGLSSVGAKVAVVDLHEMTLKKLRMRLAQMLLDLAVTF